MSLVDVVGAFDGGFLCMHKEKEERGEWVLQVR